MHAPTARAVAGAETAAPIPSNCASFTLAEVAATTRGVLREADGSLRVAGVVIDSRRAHPGTLFVAVRGAERDGHEFVADARMRGAAAVVVERGRVIAGPRVEVDDPREALGRLARAHADRLGLARARAVVAVAGSNGKTTTKELLARLLGALAGPTLATPGNLNNALGVPLTVLSLTPSHASVVIECGTSAPGEIARLGAIVAPTVALVLNVSLEHAAHFPDLDAIADEECALFSAARHAAVGNADDPRVAARLALHRPRAFAFGRHGDVRLRARRATATARALLEIEVGPRVMRAGRPSDLAVDYGLLGPAAAENAVAALAAVAAAQGGLTDDDVATLAAALAAAAPVPGRLAPRRGPAGAVLLDDSYNANPASVRAAIEAADEIAKARGGRILVGLGDMLDLGAASAAAHREACAAVLARAGTLVGYGEAMHRALGERRDPPTGDVLCAPSVAALVDALAARATEQDVVLVKGSRGMRMERAVAALEA